MATDHSTPAQTRSEPPRERELFMLAGLGAIVRWFEELFALLSGPVLTFGLGIALIDLLTDGKLLASIPALLFAWAASQAVGLDAQLVGSSAKLASAFRHRAVWPIIGYTLLVTALGIVAYQASNVFATQQADGITTAQALARLGMDSTSWLIERSVLAVFLVILSGLLRYVAPAQQQVSLEDERTQLERELTLEPLRQKLRAQQVGGIRALAQTALTGHGASTNAPTTTSATSALTTETTPRMPAMPSANGQNGNSKLNNRAKREALAAAMYGRTDEFGARAHPTSPRDEYSFATGITDLDEDDTPDWGSSIYPADDWGAYEDDGTQMMQRTAPKRRNVPARMASRATSMAIDLPSGKTPAEKDDSPERRRVLRFLDKHPNSSVTEIMSGAKVSKVIARAHRDVWIERQRRMGFEAANATQELPAVVASSVAASQAE